MSTQPNVPADEATDRDLLRQLVQQYARAADLRDDEMFADAFTDDAVLFTGRSEIVGRERLLDVVNRLSRYRVTMHLVGNHYVDFTGADSATGQAYCVASHVYEEDGVDRVYVMHIIYNDTYRRGPDGWRIAERRLDVLWDEDRPLRS